VTASIGPSLLHKYNVPGPRYTSYPTVPVWSSEFGESQYRQALARLAGADRAGRPAAESHRAVEPISVYLHLPFCARRCHYCGCTSLEGEGRFAVDEYLDCVEIEVALVNEAAGGPHPATHVHWGGGTPNYLEARQVGRALRLIREAFVLDENAEFSLEADPRLGSVEQAVMLRQSGFNRISLGVQDTDPEVQRAIGRNQTEERTRRFYEACVAAGFASVNVDLVYGLPAQTQESFARTLEVVREMSPGRIACFSYAHVPWARPNQRRIDASLLPSPEEKFRLFQQAVEALTGAGYEWIGMDHFAKRDDDLAVAYRNRTLNRSFMGYTTSRGELLALGMSGISEVGGCFAQNSSDLAAYKRTVTGGRLAAVRGCRLSREDMLRRRVITHLMCNMELPFDLTLDEFGVRVDEAFGPELEEMESLAADGLVAMEPDRMRVTEKGRFFVRNICMEWDAYLDRSAKKPVFSRTI